MHALDRSAILHKRTEMAFAALAKALLRAVVVPFVEHEGQRHRVENNEAQEPVRIMRGQAVAHESDEARKDHCREGKYPHNSAEQLYRNGELEHAMNEKIGDNERFGSVRESCCAVPDRMSDAIVGIARDFRRRQRDHIPVEPPRAGGGDDRTGDRFERAIESLEGDRREIGAMQEGRLRGQLVPRIRMAPRA